MSRFLCALIGFLALAGAAVGQIIPAPGVTQSGAVTASHCASWAGNNQIQDAGAACGSGSGAVTTTGSPALGNLTAFSGASSITSGNLSGDCTTSGALAVTCTKTAGTAFGGLATLSNSTNQNYVLAGPTSGSGSGAYRALVAGDIPSLSASYCALSGCTLTGALVDSVAGAASTPAINITGSWFTGGSASTTTPQVYLRRLSRT